jgi:hypothetical protein
MLPPRTVITATAAGASHVQAPRGHAASRNRSQNHSLTPPTGGIRLVFQSKPQSWFRVFRADDLVAFGQAGSQQIATLPYHRPRSGFCARTPRLETTCAADWKHLPLVCYATRISLVEQDETRFLSPRCFRFGHNLRDGVNQSYRIAFE